MQLITLVGFKGSGKDTAGNILVDDKHFHRFSFAESLKDCLATIFRWDRAMLEGDTKDSREWRETVDAWWANKLGIPTFSPRWAMQNFGTDVMRKHFHTDVWVMNVERRIAQLPADSNVAVIDARFPNEITAARRWGGKIIRVKRGPEPDWFPIAKMANIGCKKSRAQMVALGVHESEWAWIGQPIDVTIENDGTIEDLWEKVGRECQ